MSYPGIVFSFFLRGPCFTPHAACCLCMTSCVAGACVVFALLCCFLEGWVWILWPPEMWLFVFSFCTQSCQSTSSVCLPEVPQINAPMTHTSILVSGGWRSRAVILQSLSDHTVLVCSVCVCAFDVSGLRQNGVYLLSLSSSPASFVPTLCLFPPTPEQARRELRRLKEEARRKHAVALIWAYWQGLKVPPSPTAQPSTSLPPTRHPWLSSSSSGIFSVIIQALSSWHFLHFVIFFKCNVYKTSS